MLSYIFYERERFVKRERLYKRDRYLERERPEFITMQQFYNLVRFRTFSIRIKTKLNLTLVIRKI
jgi:hypothetical protein